MGSFAVSAGASAVALGLLSALWPALGWLEVAIFAGWSPVGSALAALRNGKLNLQRLFASWMRFVIGPRTEL